ncbi:tetratricopeptide repeat protein [Rasiella rasia]|uniref:Tetratricopeptide repeat protein n=1 Tax=Rasiella rasia TaxID=2744027 RepID=A0A6G6GHT0_9FLAO|nr:tetratricopeptide repeat protein [Rasiella rasia]QIE58102.1 tetratricopeptide repeat protein [Rasiella rasia]
MNLIKYISIICLVVISCSQTISGQHEQRIDSLKKEVAVLVYSNPELAIEKSLELYKLSTENPSGQVNALLTVANGYAVLKEHDQVFNYALKADSIAAINKIYTDQIRVLGFIGGQYRRLQLSGKALQYLDQAYNLSLKHPLPDSLGFIQGNILVVKGLIQKDDLGCAYALPFLKDAVNIFKESTEKKLVNANLAITLNNLGDCNIEIENYSEAKANYNEAIHFAKPINAIKSIAASRVGLAKLLTLNGNHQEAIAILSDALKLIEDVNDTGTNIQIWKALSENYLLLGNEERHTYYTQLYIEEENKLLEEEKKSLNKVTDKLSSENQEKRQNQKNKYTYLFLFSGAVLLLIVLLIYLNIAKKRRKIAKSKEKINKSSNNR